MPKLSCFNNLATVVQFGLGHQIANLVTRVQIPAVASKKNTRFEIWLGILIEFLLKKYISTIFRTR